MTRVNDDPAPWKLYASRFNVGAANHGDFQELYIRDITLEIGERRFWFPEPTSNIAVNCDKPSLKWRAAPYSFYRVNWPARWSETEVPRDLALRMLAYLSQLTVQCGPPVQAVFQEVTLARQT